MADLGRRGTSSASGRDEEAVATPRTSESLRESLALLPRRALFVAVALVQIGVELATKAVQSALAGRNN